MLLYYYYFFFTAYYQIHPIQKIWDYFGHDTRPEQKKNIYIHMRIHIKSNQTDIKTLSQLYLRLGFDLWHKK